LISEIILKKSSFLQFTASFAFWKNSIYRLINNRKLKICT
jgi:hypothetical protein